MNEYKHMMSTVIATGSEWFTNKVQQYVTDSVTRKQVHKHGALLTFSQMNPMNKMSPSEALVRM